MFGHINELMATEGLRMGETAATFRYQTEKRMLIGVGELVGFQ